MRSRGSNPCVGLAGHAATAAFQALKLALLVAACYKIIAGDY
jgi:hypothetical protein